jgi:hypothetical protein
MTESGQHTPTKYVRGMTVQALLNELNKYPASAPVGVTTPDATGGWDLVETEYNGEYVILHGGDPS